MIHLRNGIGVGGEAVHRPHCCWSLDGSECGVRVGGRTHLLLAWWHSSQPRPIAGHFLAAVSQGSSQPSKAPHHHHITASIPIMEYQPEIHDRGSNGGHGKPIGGNGQGLRSVSYSGGYSSWCCL